MTLKILFLDIDGVLHSDTNASFGSSSGEVLGSELFIWLPILLTCLKPFPEVKVVLHSAWRWIWDNDEALFAQLPEELKAVLHVVPTTNRAQTARYASIVEFIRVHNVVDYVIIDDVRSEFPRETPHLIITNPKKGLSNSRESDFLRMALIRMTEAKT